MRETFTRDFDKTRPLGDEIVYSEYPSLRKLYTSYKNWSMDSGYRYTNRGIFTERVSYLAPKLKRTSGLQGLKVDEIDGVECLIIPEMNDMIIRSSIVGASNEGHAEYACKYEKEHRELGQEPDRSERDELPKEGGSEADTSSSGSNFGGEERECASAEEDAVHSVILENASVRALIERYESRSDTKNFCEYYNTQTARELRRSSGMLFDMSAEASWGLAIILTTPELSAKLPMRLTLAIYDALIQHPKYQDYRFGGWVKEQEQRIITQFKTWGVNLTAITGNE